MSTKICSKCGWEYPESYDRRKCRFCGTAFKVEKPKKVKIPRTHCARCGEPASKFDSYGRCTKCTTELHNNWRIKRTNASFEKYDDWLNKIKDLPMQPLTEEQWLEACRYFRGCAYCGASEISSRSMFIEYENGGRYCSWNIVPACEKCETSIRRENNPFKRFDHVLNRKVDNQATTHGFSLDKLQRIVDYLTTKMEVK